MTYILRVCALLLLGVPAPKPPRILFIGNSLTYVNDLPGMLAALARTPTDSLEVVTVARPNLALIDHVHGESDALARIKQGGWDYVVLQQGPTSRMIDRDTLLIAVRILDEKIRAIGARTVIYEVWPPEERLAYFDSVIAAHHAAAESVGALLIPAGEAWKAAWEVNDDLELYDVDSFHPSPLGTYLVALTFYECLLHGDARHLPRGLHLKTNASLDLQRLAQQVAHDTAARVCLAKRK